MTDTVTGRPPPAEEPVFFATFDDIAAEPSLWPMRVLPTHGSLEVLEMLRLASPEVTKPARRRRQATPKSKSQPKSGLGSAVHRCERCTEKLPVRARKGTRFCSTRCRVAAHRAGLPLELRKRPRWVTHSPAKVPLTPRGRPASSTNPATWSPFEAVADMPRRGFVLDGDGIACIDLDHCLSSDGRVTGRAAEVLARAPHTYVEVSPSGTGLHVWGRAQVPQGRRLPDGVEMYGTGRYIAVTGRRFGRCPSTLGGLDEVVAWLLET